MSTQLFPQSNGFAFSYHKYESLKRQLIELWTNCTRGFVHPNGLTVLQTNFGLFDWTAFPGCTRMPLETEKEPTRVSRRNRPRTTSRHGWRCSRRKRPDLRAWARECFVARPLLCGGQQEPGLHARFLYEYKRSKPLWVLKDTWVKCALVR